LAITALAFDIGKSLTPSTRGGEETAKGVMEALRAITVNAHFTHDPHGGLHPVKTHVRWVHQSEYEQTQATRVQKTLEAIKKLRDGNGKPPYATIMHMKLGKIGLSYKQLKHILHQREALGQNIDVCFQGMADCLIHGDLKIEPSARPQIWASYGKHQVCLMPFYEHDKKSKDFPDDIPWVVTGYEMDEYREQKTKNAKSLEIQILTPKPT
jgi:hypothetical protein